MPVSDSISPQPEVFPLCRQFASPLPLAAADLFSTASSPFLGCRVVGALSCDAFSDRPFHSAPKVLIMASQLASLYPWTVRPVWTDRGLFGRHLPRDVLAAFSFWR